MRTRIRLTRCRCRRKARRENARGWGGSAAPAARVRKYDHRSPWRASEVMRHDGDIRPRIEMRKQTPFLDHIAEFPAKGFPVARLHDTILKPDFAGIWKCQSCHQPQDGRFPAPAWAEQNGDGGWLNLQIDGPEGVNIRISL